MLSHIAGFVFLAFLLQADAYRILGISPMPGHSHNVMFLKLMKSLAQQGHEVDVVSHYPLDTNISRYNDISIKGTIPDLTNNMSLEFATRSSFFGALYVMLQLVGVNMCKTILGTPQAEQIRNTTKNYDLLITELFGSDCYLGFAHHLQIPVALITTTVSLPWGLDRIGNPDNPAYIPNYFSTYTDEMTFFERLYNTLSVLFLKFSYKFVSDRQSNIIAKEFFGYDLPDLPSLANNISLILVNSHFSLNYARPMVPNYVEVGGIHIDDPKPLPPSLDAYLNKHKEGVVLLSMGSLLKTDTFPPEKLQSMFDALGNISQAVLWKGVKEDYDKNLKIPKNIHFQKWLPQRDVLCHPNIKLFITHGGALGGQEAIHCGVPRLGIPQFAEQEMNIKAAQRLDLAKHVAFHTLNEDNFKAALTELLENPIYKENAKAMSMLYKDRPLSAMDTALYWIEYVIKYKGAPHLRSKGADLPWYKYFLIDVILFCISCLIAVILLSYRIFIRFRKDNVKTKLKKS